MGEMIHAVNTVGRGFCEYAAGVFLQTGVLVAILLCTDLFLRRRVRATLRYWVWMLVFMKLLLPPSLSVPTGVGYWLGDGIAPGVPTAAIEEIETPVTMAASAPAAMPPVQPPHSSLVVPEPIESVTARSEPLTWQGGVFVLWIAGVLVFAGLVIQRWRFVKGLIARSEPVPPDLVDVLDECRRRMGIRGRVGLRLSPDAFSPAVCGLLNPTILVPRALLDRLSPEGLKAVLIHELAHVKRGDLWVSSLQTVLQMIHFYNPLVWLANAIVRRVREQAVDEMVLVALGAEAKSYSHTLIDIAEMAFLRVSPALRLVGVAESRKSLEGRIKHMMTRPIPKSARVGVAGVLVVVLIGAILLPMATAQTKTRKPQFTATLPNGVTVELVGICNWAQGERTCWKPDGSMFDMAMRAREWDRPRAANDYGFMLKITGRTDIDLTRAIDEAQKSSGSEEIVDAQGNRLEGYRAITASMTQGSGQTTLRLGLAAGPWSTTWSHDGKQAKAEGGDAGGMLWSQAFEDSEGMHIVASTRGGDDFARQVVAIDTKGTMHVPAGTHTVSVTHILQLTATFRNLKRDDVREFQFQVRPYEWVRFENVPLVRGAKTEVEVWIKSVPQPSGQETVQTTPDGPPAKLPEDQRSLDQTLQMAEDLRRAQEFEPARRAYQSIIQEWPDTEQAASARMGLVDLELASLIQAGDQTAAQQAIERVMTEFNANSYLPRTLDRVGDQYARIRQYETAESFYRKVIAMAADDERAADAQSAIAWLYFERGLYDDALREYAKVVQDYAGTTWAPGGQYWLAQCHFRKGELDQARKEYEKTVEMYPDDKYAGYARKQMDLIERRREDEARRAGGLGGLRASTRRPPAEAGAGPMQRAQLNPPAVLNGGAWDARVSEILKRMYAAIEKAYQDAGLSAQELGTIYQLQMPAQELMTRYRASWPAILDTRETATDELASLGADGVPILLKARDESGERRGGDLFVAAIARVGEKAVPAAIEGLSNEDPPVRSRAAASLGRLRDPRAVEPLIHALADSDPRVRREVVMALGALGDPRAVDSLLDLWSKEGKTDSGILAWALAATGAPRAVEPIMAALQECLSRAKETGDWDRDSMRMSSYAGALGRLGDSRAMPLLNEALLAGPQTRKSGAPVFLVGEAAAHALRQLGSEVTGDREKGGYQVAKTSSSGATAVRQPVVRQTRDYEAARGAAQPMELWRVQEYGCGGSPRTWQALQSDTKRPYPITLVWPLIQEASKYVVTVKGLRGSRPARSYEMVTNSLRLERADIEPGRYQWSVSVYDGQGQFLGEVETIEPVDVFAVKDSEPARQNGRKVLIDLNHSAGSIVGWGLDNHGQYLTKELLEQAGFEVEVNARGLLTPEKLRSFDLLLCHYYWAGWPDFRPFSRSELEAVRRFVEEGNSLLVIGCDRTDGGGRMIVAGNELVKEFGFLFKLDERAEQNGWAGIVPDQDVIRVKGRIQVQLPVGVQGEDSVALLQFQGIPIVRAKPFGKGRIIVAGVGMSFLDCYLGDYEHREPLHAAMFYDFVRYLTGVDCGQPEALLLR